MSGTFTFPKPNPEPQPKLTVPNDAKKNVELLKVQLLKVLIVKALLHFRSADSLCQTRRWAKSLCSKIGRSSHREHSAFSVAKQPHEFL